MAGISPTQRTLAYLKEQGLSAHMVERYVRIPSAPGGGKRIDLLHIIDIITVSPETGIGGVQSCGSAFSDHYKKIISDYRDNTKLWLDAGGTLLLIGWRKLKRKKQDGTYSKLYSWEPRIKEITLADLEES